MANQPSDQALLNLISFFKRTTVPRLMKKEQERQARELKNKK